MPQANATATPPPPPTPADAVPEEEMPKRFGKYTLIRRIALGGMAELFLALQKSMAGFEKLIVVKRILPKLAKDEEFIQMLLSEARIAATLSHPNIAHIYDVGVSEDRYYIAMEHVHGEDLRSIVRQMKIKGVRSFPLEHTLAIVLGCAKGLAYAHERRDMNGEPMHIVHRDVSPQNALVTFTGDVKLVDFGIAKAGQGVEDTKAGQLKGKVPYMSPEQAQGRELDARSDIFSLGVMLFELCTGKRLFRGTSEFETLKKIVEGPYPAPRDINPNLSLRLERIILKSLERNPNERYASARDMQSDLEAYIRDEQLAVSTLSLGEWMQDLFKEKLAQQKRMLQEGRELAEVIAEQIAEEERLSLTGTGIRTKPASRIPWVIALVAALSALGVAGYLLTRPKPIAARVGPGVIQVSSTPPGAAIWLDGNRRSERTPASLSHLPLGRYELKVTADGFVPTTQTIQLTQATPHAAASLTLERPTAASYGVLQLRSVPPGAHILLDGQDTQLTTPATVPEIVPGEEHQVALALDGYVTKTFPIRLTAGQVAEQAHELERAPLGPDEAILHLVTDPAIAHLELGGERHEEGSPFEIRVPARTYRLVLTKTGFRRIERSVILPGGEVTELSITMERAPVHDGPPPSMNTAPSGPGALTFDARPWCNVSIDGHRVGQTPIVNRSLPSGRHHVSCVNPELNVTRNVTVDISPGQTTRQRITLP